MNEKNNPFNILGSDQVPTQKGQAINEENNLGELNERIERLIKSSDVFLFMKGTPDFPQCGFSANVVGILNSLNTSFNTFDILSDMELRQGIKEYSNWPTYPQLYYKGQLLGGNDIIMEMFEAGELQSALGMA
jgi:monothiol glutaredoxin